MGGAGVTVTATTVERRRILRAISIWEETGSRRRGTDRRKGRERIKEQEID